MPHYLKARWDESRGDTHDDWGRSWWYIELADDGCALRQIEQYDTGIVLKYSEAWVEDEYGCLAERPIEPNDMDWLPMTAQDFEALWQGAPAYNAT